MESFKPTAPTGPAGAALGNLCWLECGEAPADALVGEVERLAASLGGRAVTRGRTTEVSALEVTLPNAAVGQFKAALALAGGAFEPAGAEEPAGAIIVMIGPKLSQQNTTTGDA